FVLAWLSPAPFLYYLVFFFLGLFLGSIIVSGILVVLEFSSADRRPTYAGLANTGVGLAATVAPLIGAGLAAMSYSLLFILSAAASLLAVILMRWCVREPRWIESQEPQQLL